MRTRTSVFGASALAIPAFALIPASSDRTPDAAMPAADAAVKYLTRPEGRIAYDDAGTGPLVIMVPSLGDLRQEYRFLAPRMVAAGYRAVTVDVRGHGASSAGWSDYSSAALGSDIVALVRELNAGPATLIGTSMGAGAVAWAAAEAGASVNGLVVIGPFVRQIPATSWLKNLGQQVMIRAAFGGPWAPAAWGAYYASLYPTAKPADFAAYKANLVASLKQPGRMEATKAMMHAPKADVEARLAEVRVPTLVVMGSKDPDFADPAAEARTVAGLLHGKVQIIEGAGHYPHAEMPDTVAPLILDFLAGRQAS